MSAKKVSSDRKRSRPVTKKSKFTKIRKNRILMIFIALILISGFVAGSYLVYVSTNISENDNSEVTNEDVTSYAIINTTEGIIEVELYTDLVPDTCENFIKLANDGFYDGLIFHRILDGFMIQGGGFTQDFEKKQSPYGTIALEINPELSHVDGAISMARQGDPNIDSATSEFFICDGDQGYRLDDSVLQQYGSRGYAVFGQTVEGLDIVHKISGLDLDPDRLRDDGSGPPLNDVIINSITIEER
jgi:peptidyl-prolyl cis-trans isomerase B (cyclophilin B)